MRLEVIIDDDQPLFFPFSKKLVVGSDPACDIVIEHPEVSKKHVSLYPEDDRFYIIDQGSRNGTYLNDERLIPGKKIEFTSFFPVRLGKSILISMISDEEVEESTKIEIPFPTPQPTKPSAPRNNEATTVISLKDLRSTKTEQLVKKKTAEQKKRGAKEPPKKKPKKKAIGAPQILAFSILAGAYGIHHWSKTDEVDPVSTNPAVKKAQKASADDKVKLEKQQASIVPTGGDILTSLLLEGKQGCATEAEKEFCNIGKDIKFFRFTDKGADLIVEFAPYAEKAKAILQEYDKKTRRTIEYTTESKEIAQVATAIYYLESLIRFPKLENLDAVLTLGFSYKLGEIETIAAVGAFKISLLPSLAVVLNYQRIESLKSNGVSVLELGQFYQVWHRDKILWKGPGTAEPKALTSSEDTTPTSSTPGSEENPSLAPTSATPQLPAAPEIEGTSPLPSNPPSVNPP